MATRTRLRLQPLTTCPRHKCFNCDENIKLTDPMKLPTCLEVLGLHFARQYCSFCNQFLVFSAFRTLKMRSEINLLGVRENVAAEVT